MTEATCFAGDQVKSLRVFGQTVDLWLSPNHSEVQRRAAIGAGALSDDMIRALLSVPVGTRVSISGVGADLLVLLDEAVELGAAEIVGGDLMRRAVPPVTLEGIIKRIYRWEDAQSLTLLRTHAARLALAEPPLAARMLQEIDPEVGVAITTRHGPRLHRRPGTRWVRPSWQQWAIAEAAYVAWRA